MHVLAPLALLTPLLCQELDSPKYHDGPALEAALRAAAAKDPSRVKLESIGASVGGAPIWCATLSEGDASTKSAILVVAGANGVHLVGTEMALAFVEEMAARAATDAGVAECLREHAFYVVPRVNPDGAAAAFVKPAREHAGNGRPVDADRDRRLDEDGPDDVDGDGVITSMRIPDPAGDYLVDVKDPRIVRKADRAKGERGTHKLVVEGLDNDGDGEWNEDGADGVRVDRNFPHAWKEHDRATGTSSVSEPESRALADFVLTHRNIAGVVVFGLHDNVRKAPRGESGGGDEEAASSPPSGGGRGTGGGGPGGGGGRSRGGSSAPTAILRDDLPIYERAVKLYKEKAVVEGDVEDPGSDGAIHAWAYFQRGLPSFAVRVWTPGLEKPKDAAASRPEGSASSSPESRPAGEGRGGRRGRGEDGQAPDRSGAASRPAEDEDRSKAERERLEWNDKALGGAGFVAWKAAAAPALAAKGAEVGGWKPGVLVNPPPSELAGLARKHAEFLLALTPELFPKVVLAGANLTQNGGGVATLKASIRNDGKAPALTAMARRAGAVRGVRVKLRVDGGEILAGRPQFLVTDLDPQDPPREWTWVVKGDVGSKVVLEVNGPFSPEVVYTGEIR